MTLPKAGNSTDYSDYRGIPLLSVYSKILQKHLFDNKILHTSRSGFIKGKSAVLAINELLLNMDDSVDCDQHAWAVFLDIAKAFDTVNHSLLLTKLKSCRFSTRTVNFFASYLSGRRLECIDKSRDLRSDTFKINYGVPRALYLGLFYFFFL